MEGGRGAEGEIPTIVLNTVGQNKVDIIQKAVPTLILVLGDIL